MNNGKFSELMQDIDFVKEILSTSDINKVQSMFKEKGLDISIQELEDISNSILNISNKLTKTDKSLSDSSLEEIVGGGILAKAGAVILSGLLIAGTTVACACGYEQGSKTTSSKIGNIFHEAKSNTFGTSFTEDVKHVSKTIWTGWKSMANNI